MPRTMSGIDTEMMLALKVTAGIHTRIVMAGLTHPHYHSGHKGTDDHRAVIYRDRSGSLDWPQQHEGKPAQ